MVSVIHLQRMRREDLETQRQIGLWKTLAEVSFRSVLRIPSDVTMALSDTS
jgi:hypothetical protein